MEPSSINCDQRSSAQEQPRTSHANFTAITTQKSQWSTPNQQLSFKYTKCKLELKSNYQKSKLMAKIEP